MKVSAKTEYACMAMMQLGAHYGSDEPVRVREIAEANGIPQRFLVQILLQLKGAGYVASTRGASGGYQLIRKPEDITLCEIMTVIEGTENEPNLSPNGTSVGAQVLHELWNEVTEVQREILENTTLEDLLERMSTDTKNMYYI